MAATLKLYLFPDCDGVLVCPEEVWTAPNGTKVRRPNERKRVYVSGVHDIQALNDLQKDALIALAYRDPEARTRTNKAVFYDGKKWARSRVDRRTIVYTHTWETT
jgi:hypothetical protein